MKINIFWTYSKFITTLQLRQCLCYTLVFAACLYLNLSNCSDTKSNLTYFWFIFLCWLRVSRIWQDIWYLVETVRSVLHIILLITLAIYCAVHADMLKKAHFHMITNFKNKFLQPDSELDNLQNLITLHTFSNHFI